MCSGIIEPRVNGGYKIYENAFLSQESENSEIEKEQLVITVRLS